MAWLDDNPPTRSQFRCPRRERPSGVMVLHTAENTPDFVAFDGGAEAVAGFIRDRSDAGSYHDLVDSDSGIQLVAYSCEAYQDGTGSNSHAWGGSVATRADVWPLAPDRWRDGAIHQLAAAAARYAGWLRSHYGIEVPARRISRAESERRVPGFISHAERDPGRRTDPGAEFPWAQFLDQFARLTHANLGGPFMALTAAQQQELHDRSGQILFQSRKAGEAADLVKEVHERMGEMAEMLGQIRFQARKAGGASDVIIAALEDPADVDEEAIARAVIEGLDQDTAGRVVARMGELLSARPDGS